MTVYVCDDCKYRQREAARVNLKTGRYQTDPADGRHEEIMATVDLCLPCALKRLERVEPQVDDDE